MVTVPVQEVAEHIFTKEFVSSILSAAAPGYQLPDYRTTEYAQAGL
jgi:hypothetical protein